jgi:hypothetical protein
MFDISARRNDKPHTENRDQLRYGGMWSVEDGMSRSQLPPIYASFSIDSDSGTRRGVD